MHKPTLFLVLTAAMLLLFCHVAKAESVTVSPDNAKIVYMGRFTKDYRFGWTGSAIRLRFTGTAVAAYLRLVDGKSAAMQVVVDGVPTRPIFLSDHKDRYALASHLKPGTHTVEIFKRSGAVFHGAIEFGGFLLSPGAKVKRLAQKRRKILAIGDSITCGFKNESRSATHNDNVTTENGYMSYAAIVARRLNAQIMMVCWSGRGLYRNFYLDHDREETLPKLFSRTLPMDSTPKWNQKEYIPQLILINLGTNDLDTDKGKKAPLTEREFLASYDRFIERLHHLFPKAKVIASIGPIYDKPISNWIQKLPEEFDFVHTLVFPDKDPLEDRGVGTLHPSVLGDIKMADELAPAIRSIMHWKCCNE